MTEESNPSEIFATRLTQARQIRKLSQQDLARLQHEAARLQRRELATHRVIASGQNRCTTAARQPEFALHRHHGAKQLAVANREGAKRPGLVVARTA